MNFLQTLTPSPALSSEMSSVTSNINAASNTIQFASLADTVSSNNNSTNSTSTSPVTISPAPTSIQPQETASSNILVNNLPLNNLTTNTSTNNTINTLLPQSMNVSTVAQTFNGVMPQGATLNLANVNLNQQTTNNNVNPVTTSTTTTTGPLTIPNNLQHVNLQQFSNISDMGLLLSNCNTAGNTLQQQTGNTAQLAQPQQLLPQHPTTSSINTIGLYHHQHQTPHHPIAEFLYQLTKMLTDDNRHVIEWTSGRICVHDPQKLADTVLHKYFRHSKYASFQRQLNYFGFRKIAGKGKMSPCSYVNDAATNDLRSLLFIKRKTNGSAARKNSGGKGGAAESKEDGNTTKTSGDTAAVKVEEVTSNNDAGGNNVTSTSLDSTRGLKRRLDDTQTTQKKQHLISTSSVPAPAPAPIPQQVASSSISFDPMTQVLGQQQQQQQLPVQNVVSAQQVIFPEASLLQPSQTHATTIVSSQQSPVLQGISNTTTNTAVPITVSSQDQQQQQQQQQEVLNQPYAPSVKPTKFNEQFHFPSERTLAFLTGSSNTFPSTQSQQQQQQQPQASVVSNVDSHHSSEISSQASSSHNPATDAMNELIDNNQDDDTNTNSILGFLQNNDNNEGNVGEGPLSEAAGTATSMNSNKSSSSPATAAANALKSSSMMNSLPSWDTLFPDLNLSTGATVSEEQKDAPTDGTSTATTTNGGGTESSSSSALFPGAHLSNVQLANPSFMLSRDSSLIDLAMVPTGSMLDMFRLAQTLRTNNKASSVTTTAESNEKESILKDGEVAIEAGINSSNSCNNASTNATILEHPYEKVPSPLDYAQEGEMKSIG